MTSRRTRRLAPRAGLVASAAAAAMIAGAPTSAVAASGPEYFGTNLQTLGAVTPAKRADVLAQLAAGGLTLDRIQIDWRAAEPSPPAGGKHTYSWGSTDGQMAQLARLGIRTAPLFRFTPGWTHIADATKPFGVDELPPARYADFAAFIQAFAARYGEGGAFWKANPSVPAQPVRTFEVWNEANLAEYAWSGVASPETYSALLKVVRPALKAVQPNGVLLGSLAYQETEVPDYVPRMAAAGGLDAIDAMGYHPYAPEALETIDLVHHLRDELTAAGHGAMPIFANEAGQEAIVTNPDGTTTPNVAPATWAFQHFPTDAARGANLAFAGEALAASDCGVEQFLPYSVSGTERDGEKLTEAYMGLFRPATGAPTLTAQALFRAAKRWQARFAPGGPGVPARLSLCQPGTSPDAALLPLDAEITGTELGCVKARATYDGGPLESAILMIRTPSGTEIARKSTNAFGEAAACAPGGSSDENFRASVEFPNAGRSGTVACDIVGTGCPTDAALRPAVGQVLSAAVATNAQPAPTPAPPRPSSTPVNVSACAWDSKTRPVQFTLGKRGKLSSARLATTVRCDTAPVGAAFRFIVMVRTKGAKKALKARTLWLKNGVEQRFTLKGRFRNGHQVVLTYRQDPNAGIPQLRDTVTLRAVARRK